jgi:hypothetical protein
MNGMGGTALKVLCVAEKPSIAKDIASIFGAAYGGVQSVCAARPRSRGDMERWLTPTPCTAARADPVQPQL